MPRTRAESIRRTVAFSSVSLAAVVSARVLLRPRPSDVEHGLLDWDRVRSIAHARSGETGTLRNDAARAGQYDSIARDLAPYMAEVLGDEPVHFPKFRAIDRRGFIDSNLLIAQRLMQPVEELRALLPESRATALSRAVMSRYVGGLFGFLSHRVLGQYDPVLQLGNTGADDATTSLFLVETNLERFIDRQDVPGDALRRWLILHELTHAWQFESHPWLRDYIAGLMRDLMMAGMAQADDAGTPQLPTSREVVTRLPQSLRTQLRGMGRIQAVMSVLEGYSNFVMHRVGSAHLEHFDTLEKAFHSRQKQRSLLEQFVMTVTGMRIKMRQYELGEKFSEAVTDRAGLETLNLVWERAENMPSMVELRDADLWLRRVAR